MMISVKRIVQMYSALPFKVFLRRVLLSKMITVNVDIFPCINLCVFFFKWAILRGFKFIS